MKTYFYNLEAYVLEEEKKFSGAVYAESYSDAMHELASFYGENEILRVTLDETPYDSILEIPEDVINTLREEEIW